MTWIDFAIGVLVLSTTTTFAGTIRYLRTGDEGAFATALIGFLVTAMYVVVFVQEVVG